MDIPPISPDDLPSKPNESFLESSYFVKNRALPSLQDVRLRATGSKELLTSRPPPVKFEALNLIVKYGDHITIAEGQCLWLLRKRLSKAVAVPEIYGWRTDDNETFLYMELIRGDTLEKCWTNLTRAEKLSICDQLKYMVSAWRQLRQDCSHKFIGQIAGQPFLDILFEDGRSPSNGPVKDVASFHDLFARLSCKPERYSRDRPEFRGLSDSEQIVFTHGDLHRSNILVSKDGIDGIRVKSIVDWHQSGWYPSSWEFCKANSTVADYREDWATEFIPKFLPAPNTAYYESFEWIRMCFV